MSKYLLAGAAVAAIALSPAIAQSVQPAPAPAPAPQALIHHAPIAKVHSRAEVGAHVRAMFERLDTNRDGFVTKAEAQAARAHRADRVIKRIRHGAAGSPEQRLADRGAMFDRIDTNRDGSISREEFAKVRENRVERRIVMREKLKEGEAAPSDGKGGVSHNGAMGLMQHPGGYDARRGGLGGRMFDMADANKDGRVTLQEATAAAYRHFDMADANRDGQVTREERMQMRQKMRAERRPG